MTTKDGKQYVSVVQDYYQNGQRKIRTLKSFGRKTQESLARAYQFKANCEAVGELKAHLEEPEVEELLAVVKVVFGFVIGIKVLEWLLEAD